MKSMMTLAVVTHVASAVVADKPGLTPITKQLVAAFP